MIELDWDNENDCIRIIKNIVSRLSHRKIRYEGSGYGLDRELAEDVSDVSYSMFSKRKLERMDYTLQNNHELKKIKIDPDTNSLSELDTLITFEILRNNIEAFHTLVSQCFVKKSNNDVGIENHLFCIQLKSIYSSEISDIYFVFRNHEFFVFILKSEKMTFLDYIKTYYGNIDDKLELQLNLLKHEQISNHEEMQIKLNSIFQEEFCSFNNAAKWQEGCISFYDFLGWKGVWLYANKDQDPLKDVSSLIESFTIKLQELTIDLMPFSDGMQISKLISISDTIAIFTPKVPNINSKDLMILHAEIAQYIIEESIKKKYPIRGAINYGNYNFKNNVMVGPGIDECASWHEKCDWIGVHFTPSAQFEIMKYGIMDSRYIKKLVNKIPIKSGLPRLDYCVNWSISDGEFRALLDNVKALVPEIASKYLNTEHFRKSFGEEA